MTPHYVVIADPHSMRYSFYKREVHNWWKERGITPEMQERMMKPDTLTGRPGRPEDVANAMLWLCSPAGSWISGQTINVHGGGTVFRLFGQ